MSGVTWQFVSLVQSFKLKHPADRDQSLIYYRIIMESNNSVVVISRDSRNSINIDVRK